MSQINPQQDFVAIEYFQFSKNKSEKKIHNLSLLHVYIQLLDVFSAYYVTGRKLLPDEWLKEVKEVGAHIERQLKYFREQLALEQTEASS